MSTVHVPASPFHDYPAPAAAAPAKPDSIAVAERRMHRGRRLVIGGFAVAVAGIIGYCLACFGASQNSAWSLMKDPAWFVTPSLGVIGLGTLLWLLGSIQFLNGAMDSGPEGPDINF